MTGKSEASLLISCVTLAFLKVQGAIFAEKPGCFAWPASKDYSKSGPVQCFIICQTDAIGIMGSRCYCTLPNPLASVPCYPAITCKDGHSPCGFGERMTETTWYSASASMSVYNLNACFLAKLQSIEYSSVSGLSDDTTMVEVGKSVTFSCTAGRYPNAGTEWWLSKAVQCVTVMIWENVVNTLKCNLACEKPSLENGIIGTYPMNAIGKVDIGTSTTASCNDGLELSSGVDVEVLTCQGTVANWEPEVNCKQIPGTCSKPVLQNGKISTYSLNSLGNVNPGTIVTCSCNDGYQLSTGSTSVMTCQENWTPAVNCLPICYLNSLKSVSYSSISGYQNGQTTVNVGETVTFTCIGNRYPNSGSQWWTSKSIACIGVKTWENIICSAACDVPVLPNGLEGQYSLNSIGKVNAGTILKLTCNYGYELTPDTHPEMLCQETDSRWFPQFSCKAVCYIETLKSIPYSNISGYSVGQVTAAVGEIMKFSCTGRRYPNFNVQWWLIKTVKCAGSNTWEKVKCSAACDVPLLENGKLTVAPLNQIGKVNAGTTVASTCKYGFRLSNDAESETLACRETDSLWFPHTTCKPICYLQTLQSIRYSNVTSMSKGQTTVDVGQTVNFNCIGLRYPVVQQFWSLSLLIECVKSITWQYDVQCRAACDKPKLENGQFDAYTVNNIEKVNGGETVTAYCNYGFIMSSETSRQDMICKEVDSQWSSNVTCFPRCRLLCVNNGTCIEDLLGKSQTCSCLIGFTGVLCETAITKGPYVDELIKIRDQTALFTTVADMSLYVMAQVPVQNRTELEVPSNELISECSLAAKRCGPYRQNAFVQMGSCYTINYDPRNAQIVKQAGVSQGMHLVLFNNETEFLAHSLVKGVKLIIHDKDEAVFPENQGRFLSSGFHVMIGIKVELINKFHRKCASEDVLPSLIHFYNGSYTHEGCLKSCHQKKVIETCGCGDPNVDLDPEDPKLRYCMLEKRECVNSVRSITNEECRCPEACRTPIYETTYSFAKWPAKHYNVPLCKHLSTKEKIWKDKWLKECNGAFRASHIKVDIFYKNLAYSVYTELPVYSFWNLWSGVGSILAIFFGVSYIFFFEFLLLIYELCFAAAKKLIRLWRKMISAVSPEQPNVQE